MFLRMGLAINIKFKSCDTHTPTHQNNSTHMKVKRYSIQCYRPLIDNNKFENICLRKRIAAVVQMVEINIK